MQLARRHPRFALAFALSALALLPTAACFQAEPAIEVFDANGQSHLDADPYLILNFGDVDSTLGISKNLTIRNTGRGTLEVSEVCFVDTAIDVDLGPCTTQATEPYSIDVTTPTSLDFGEEITVRVTYTPTFAAPNKVLRINSNDPSTPAIKVFVAGSIDIIPGSLSGCICNDGVGWVEGASVSVLHEEGTVTATTDDDGCFLMEQVPSGARTVEVTGADYSETIPLDVLARQHNSVGPEECDSPSGHIVGCACDIEAYAWVAGGEARVETDEVGTITTVTDANGCWVLEDVPVGEHTVTVTGDGFSESYPVSVIPSEIVGVPGPASCEPPKGNIFGCPCDTSAYSYVPGASILVETNDFGDFTGTVDNDGCFLLTDVPFGTHDVTVYDNQGYNETFIITVNEAETSLVPGPDVCAPCSYGQTFGPEVTTAPVDILFVIDNSGSMQQENDAVEDNLNAFSQSIVDTGLDHRVITVGRAEAPPPLGNGPNYLHVDTRVRSHDALLEILGHYNDYDQFLRADSEKHIIAITDDSSQLGYQSFTTQLNATTNPGWGTEWTFHSIVAYGNVPQIGCPTGAGIGNNYLALSQATGGYTKQICGADFTDVFQGIYEAVTFAGLPCVLPLDAPPANATLDPSNVEVTWQKAVGGTQVLPRNDACNGDGWRFDNPSNPSQIELCPQTCDVLGVASAGAVDLGVGCVFD